jgi:hypothetical protein
VPQARGVAGTRRGRSAAFPRGMGPLRWRCRGAVTRQGAGLREPASRARLSVEARGAAAVPATAAPRREPGPGLAHGQVRPWAGAQPPPPRAGERAPGELLRRPGRAAPLSRCPALTASTEPPETCPVCPVVGEGGGREAPPYPDSVAAVNLSEDSVSTVEIVLKEGPVLIPSLVGSGVNRTFPCYQEVHGDKEHDEGVGAFQRQVLGLRGNT